MYIPHENLERAFQEFVDFISVQDGKPFTNFSTSTFLNHAKNGESYKQIIFEKAKSHIHPPAGNRWKQTDIGSGRIKATVLQAFPPNVKNDAGKSSRNNLLDWRHIGNHLEKDSLIRETVLFNHFKGKATDEENFHGFSELKFPYQLIAYLYFIKDANQFLPISQQKLNEIFRDLGSPFQLEIGTPSWENYKGFLGLVKETREFLEKTKDIKSTLLDAHSFLWVLGDQMKSDKFPKPQKKTITTAYSAETLSVSKKAVVVDSDISTTFPEESEETFLEGGLKNRLHISLERQRSNSLVQRAKQKYQQIDKLMHCEVCEFSFFESYGVLGEYFIEAHHKVPIKMLEQATHNTPEALAMVCANCHRMLHRRTDLTIDDLRKMIQSQREHRESK